MFRTVEFPSQGAALRGRLYLRPDWARRTPIVIMAHGFSATISGMVADRYAETFYAAGLGVLLYDHRNFGFSGGEPRQEINRWVQARGYRDALNFVAALPEVDPDRIAIWGDSMSAGETILVGAIDPLVRAVVVQVPACGDVAPPPDPDGSLFASIRTFFLTGDVSGATERITGPLPVVSSDQRGTPSLLAPLTAYRWFIEYGGRHGTKWENWATVVAPAAPAPYHPALCAPHLTAPLLMVMSPEDEMPGARPGIARMTFDAAPGPKELFEITGGHFGLLHYPSAAFDQASTVQRDFLIRHLT
jgi:fermentation-respiration switch protein FrsA (DUF1100 family)